VVQVGEVDGAAVAIDADLSGRRRGGDTGDMHEKLGMRSCVRMNVGLLRRSVCRLPG